MKVKVSIQQQMQQEQHVIKLQGQQIVIQHQLQLLVVRMDIVKVVRHVQKHIQVQNIRTLLKSN